MIKDPDFEINIPNNTTTDQFLYSLRDSDNNLMADLFWEAASSYLYLMIDQSNVHPACNYYVMTGGAIVARAIPPLPGEISTCIKGEKFYITENLIDANNELVVITDFTLLYPDFRKGVTLNLSLKYFGLRYDGEGEETGNSKIMLSVDYYDK